MIAWMDVCMGGRIAEELVFGEENITSGASSDIQQATNMARSMVTKYGFSDEVGIVYYGGETGGDHASGKTRDQIDEEVKLLTSAAYERARALLKKHSKEHKLLAETLLEYETLTGDEVRDVVLKGKKLDRPVVVNTSEGSRRDQSVLKKKPEKKAGWKGLADKVLEYCCWNTTNIVNTSVFGALSIGSGLVVVVFVCMKRGDILQK